MYLLAQQVILYLDKKGNTMAITWELIPTIVNKSANLISIIAVRLDDQDPDNPLIYQVPKATLSATPSENIWILDEIWGKHQTALTEESSKITYLTNLISVGKTNLEARE